MNRLRILWHRVCHVGLLLLRGGPGYAARTVVRRLRGGPGSTRADVLKHFDFVECQPIVALPGAAEEGTLLWFIPDFNLGSGGHLNIFRIIWNLEQMGYASGIVVAHPKQHHDAAEARETIRAHFFPLQAQVHLGVEALPACEFAVATGWDTAYTVRAYQGATHKLYFVQDYEPWFFPVGTESVLAQNTYDFGFFGITAGHWLADKLAEEHGMQTHAVGFGVEHERYRRLPRRGSGKKRVFFYARPPTPRRAFELGLLVLAAVARRLPGTQFVLAGWDTSAYRIPFEHLACGTLALDDLPDMYSQCDVALVLSLTNLSLLPLELMACGCAVVSNRGTNVQWLLNDEVAVLTDATLEKLSEAICNLLEDDARRQALSEHAQAFAQSQTWEAVAHDFEAGLHRAREAAASEDLSCVA